MPLIVGTSGWQYRDWRGVVYPPGLPQRAWLEHFAGQFPAVEVNNAFYRLPERAVFERWRSQGRTTGRRPLLVYGASRRPAGELAPDRRTAYFRLPFDPAWTRDEMRAAMSRLEPEPTFPETTAGG